MGDNGKEMETTIMGYMGGCQNYGPLFRVQALGFRVKGIVFSALGVWFEIRV